MRYLLIVAIFLGVLEAKEILVSKSDIKYHQIVDYDMLYTINSDKKVRCNTFDKEKLLEHSYEAKRYIIKGHPICDKDLQIFVKQKIEYDFGNIVIEKYGKVINETKQYVKVKNPDGTVEKIYKNGRLK